jgi:hypothetical protein
VRGAAAAPDLFWASVILLATTRTCSGSAVTSIVRYDVVVELAYLAGRECLPEDARTALQLAIAAEFSAERNVDVKLANLSTAQGRGGVVEVRATLHGIGLTDLISPIDAITRVDTAVDRSLMRLGLFEEFNVAGKSLRVAPNAECAAE